MDHQVKFEEKSSALLRGLAKLKWAGNFLDDLAINVDKIESVLNTYDSV